MKKLDELAHLLANPVLPKASRHWSEAKIVISSALRPEHVKRSLDSGSREVITDHALEVSYFFEVLRDPVQEEALIDHCSKVGFFRRLAAAANACLREKPDATAHLVCAAVLRDAYAMAKQMNEGEFDFPIVAEGYQISDGLAFAKPWSGFSSINETVEFFRRRGIQIHGTV